MAEQLQTIVIAFGYKARSGKDTAAHAIVEARKGEFDVRKYAFADALKVEVNQAAQDAGGMLHLFSQLEQTFGTDFAVVIEGKKVPVTYEMEPDMTDPLCPLGKQRMLLQWWGTEYRRKQDKWYWVDKLIARLHEEKPQFAIISDLRFPNEVEFVTAPNVTGRICRIDRLGAPEVLSSVENEHVSENALAKLPDSEWSAIITVEDGDVDGLKQVAVQYFDQVVTELTPPDLRAMELELDKVPTSFTTE